MFNKGETRSMCWQMYCNLTKVQEEWTALQVPKWVFNPLLSSSFLLQRSWLESQRSGENEVGLSGDWKTVWRYCRGALGHLFGWQDQKIKTHLWPWDSRDDGWHKTGNFLTGTNESGITERTAQLKISGCNLTSV